MAKCRKCDEKIDPDASYCSECGARQKRRKKGQASLGNRDKVLKKMRSHIEDLEDQLDDAGIEFEAYEDDED